MRHAWFDPAHPPEGKEIFQGENSKPEKGVFYTTNKLEPNVFVAYSPSPFYAHDT